MPSSASALKFGERAVPNSSRISWVICMEQNFGPHIEQKWAIFRALGGQRFVVELFGCVRVEAQVELVFPAELEAGFAQTASSRTCARRVAFGQVGGVGGDLVGDHAFFTSSRLGRPRCSFGVT